MTTKSNQERDCNEGCAAPSAAYQGYWCTAPRPDSRNARASYKGRGIDVNVLQDVVREGSHILVVIHAVVRGGPDQTVEYITDYTTFEEALSAGFEMARAVIDGRES